MADLILPDVDWRNRPGLDSLTTVLGAEEGLSRFVGGAVRDALIGTPVADLDVATMLTPQAVLDRLSTAGIRAVPTGIDHGTITAVLDSGPVEVTTLRRDVSTDGRRATVAFTEDWREDAARRDFTINALYADPATGRLFDYFGGLEDLAARRVRFIGDPIRRIAEDHLRILRFFRFLARFGDTPDAEGLDACTARARDLMALSRERIRDELLKLLIARDAVRVVRIMLDRGILLPVLPEITSETSLAALAAREAMVGAAPDPIRRLAALLPADSGTAEAIGARLKLSNAQRKRLVLATDTAGVEDPRGLAYRLGRETAEDRVLLALSDPAVLPHAWSQLREWDIPRLPLTGGALVERGLAKGPDVARALRAVEDRWIAEGFPPADRVAALADSVVDQALRAPIKAKASSPGSGRA
ncbi:CCA tRNA nucleotidyltransferase [Sphingomonas sp. HT-1]|uniref:CCA tRNA nucleotidyltransferase n=1 Tax=unclassified Sphingomonas TaxID=196159 RepID=UPI00037C541D|nr:MULTISPECIES: CCA tRNA nucleotidyltransferase [unclassified Sphingomonas]KTF68966.1 polynucleotide adenylyltransferase [Sphingomonas sp. WG]